MSGEVSSELAVEGGSHRVRLSFLGTGSALPTGHRVQSGLLVEAPDCEPLLIDCGSGVLHRLAGTPLGYEALDDVLLTHHHVDHVADLLPLVKAKWLAGSESLRVVGPPGTQAFVDALIDVHGYMDGRLSLEITEVGPERFAHAGFSIAAHETVHSMYCQAYRLETETATVTVSGDSEADEELARFAEGSDVLIHDCSFPDDIDVANHPTPTQLARALAGLDVGRVFLTHLYPQTVGRHEEMLETVRSHYDGAVQVASEGQSVSVGD